VGIVSCLRPLHEVDERRGVVIISCGCGADCYTLRPGLVASSLRRSELRERARGKGPDARVARMISDQREGRVIRPL
jgi:hypothetical protein